jgi:hypothetical protein
MLKLRAAMMEKSFTWKEKRRIPGLTDGFNQQRAALLLACDDPLKERLRKCGKLDRHGNAWECSVVFCPRCLMLRRGRQTQENIKLFAHLGNPKLAFMTVLVKIIGDLAEAEDAQDKFAWRMRNTIKARRKEDPRWNEVMVKAYWEFDNLQETDEYGRNVKVAIEKLGMPPFAFGGAWLVHLHAIVALGDLTLDEFRTAIRNENAPLPYQVDVQPFRLHQDVNWNIRRITRYSMKYRIEDHYKRTGPFDEEYKHDIDAERNWWPKESVRLLATHLSREYNGYRSHQFWIGPKSATKTKVVQRPEPKIAGDVEDLASVLGVEPDTPEETKDKANVAARALIDRMKSKGIGSQS